MSLLKYVLTFYGVFIVKLAVTQGVDQRLRPFYIYSDVDDTIIASGTIAYDIFFKSVDVTLMAGRRYAGYKALVYYLSTQGQNPRPKVANLTICSARVKVFFLGGSYSKIEKKINQGPVTDYSVRVENFQYGELVNYPSFRKYGKTKYESIKKDLRKRKAEFKSKRMATVFIGDNGQGDQLAAKRLLDENEIDYAFIHIVTAQPLIKLEIGKVILFKNYKSLTENLHKLGLISDETRDKIIEAYELDFKEYHELEAIMHSD